MSLWRQIIILWGACLAVPCPRGWANDWPQFLGPHRNGTLSGAKIAGTWAPRAPKTVWSRQVGEGFSSPVIRRGRLFLFHRKGAKAILDCLDAETGKAVWRYAYTTDYRDDFGFEEGPRATPTIAGDRIVTLGAEGQIHCVDLQSGHPHWVVDARTDFGAKKGFFGFACSPLAAGDNVILNIGGSGGAGIIALDLGSGRLVWKTASDEASYSSPVLGRAGGRDVALVFARSGLYGLAPGSGEEVFHVPFRSRMNASVNAATPLVVGNQVFISASYGTGALLLDLTTPQPTKVWAGDDIMSNHYATCVEENGFLFGFHGRQEYGPSFRCVRFSDGKVMWSQERYGAGTVTLADEHLLILRENGQLVLAEASPLGFHETSQVQILGSGVRAYPALANGRLYARSPRKLVCVDLR